MLRWATVWAALATCGLACGTPPEPAAADAGPPLDCTAGFVDCDNAAIACLWHADNEADVQVCLSQQLECPLGDCPGWSAYHDARLCEMMAVAEFAECDASDTPEDVCYDSLEINVQLCVA